MGNVVHGSGRVQGISNIWGSWFMVQSSGETIQGLWFMDSGI